MPPSAAVRVLLSADQPEGVADVRGILEQAGHEVRWHPVAAAEPDDLADLHLILVEGSQRPDAVLGLCRRVRAALKESLVPLLFITDDHSPTVRLASLEAGADTYLLRPFVPGELLAQVQALLRIKDLHDRLADKTRRGATASTNGSRMRISRSIRSWSWPSAFSASFLPQTLPEVPGLRFARPLCPVRPGRRRFLRRVPARREARRLLRRRRDGPRRAREFADDLRQEGRPGQGDLWPVSIGCCRRARSWPGSTAT